MKKLLEKREGFTLIELLAVIVILAVIMLVASTSVTGVMKNAKQGTFRNEFLSLLESAQIKANLDQMGGTILKSPGDTKCYKLSEITQFSKSGDSNYQGSVKVTKKADNTLEYKAWLSNKEFIIKGQDAGVQLSNISDWTADAKDTCAD